MATLDWQVTAEGETSLVELFVTSDTETRVEIASNLEPVWPPRRENRPVAGWDGSGFEGVVSAGEPLVLGYASPDDPVEPPATIVESEPVTGSSEGPPSPETLVRELGAAGPPRDAVPAHGSPSTDPGPGTDRHPPGHGQTDEKRPVDRSSVADDRGPSTRESASASTQGTGHSGRDDDTRSTGGSGTGRTQTSAGGAGSADGSRTRRSQRSDHARPGGSEQSVGPTQRTERARTDGSTVAAGRGPRGKSRGTDTDGPGEAIDAWLGALGGRIETAERLAAVETAGEARAAVDAAGGIEQVRLLCDRLDADRRRLERIEQRHDGLGDRLDEIDVPLSALERLA